MDLKQDFLNSTEYADCADSISRFVAASALAGSPPEFCGRCSMYVAPLDVTMIQDNTKFHVDCNDSSWARGFALAKSIYEERKALKDQHGNPFYQGCPA